MTSTALITGAYRFCAVFREGLDLISLRERDDEGS